MTPSKRKGQKRKQKPRTPSSKGATKSPKSGQKRKHGVSVHTPCKGGSGSRSARRAEEHATDFPRIRHNNHRSDTVTSLPSSSRLFDLAKLDKSQAGSKAQRHGAQSARDAACNWNSQTAVRQLPDMTSGLPHTTEVRLGEDEGAPYREPSMDLKYHSPSNQPYPTPMQQKRERRQMPHRETKIIQSIEDTPRRGKRQRRRKQAQPEELGDPVMDSHRSSAGSSSSNVSSRKLHGHRTSLGPDVHKVSDISSGLQEPRILLPSRPLTRYRMSRFLMFRLDVKARSSFQNSPLPLVLPHLSITTSLTTMPYCALLKVSRTSCIVRKPS